MKNYRLIIYILLFPFIQVLAQPMNGQYGIGAGESYATFNAAVDDLKVKGVTGHAIFVVKAGTYPEQVIIPFIDGMELGAKITFEPEISALGEGKINLEYAATSSLDNFIVKLDSAFNVRLTGLTFKPTGTQYFSSLAIENGSSDIEIYTNFFHTAIVAQANVASVEANVIEIHSDELKMENILLYQNFINGGKIGVSIVGSTNSIYHSDGFTITKNYFRDNTIYSASVRDADNIDFSENDLSGSSSALFFSSTHGDVYIHNNRIKQTDAASSGIWIEDQTIGSGGPNQLVYIYNNIVQVTEGNGIYLNNSKGVEVRHNTVLSQNSSGSFFCFKANNSDTLKLYDNIILNNDTDPAVTIINSSFDLSLDRNVYYSEGVSPYNYNTNLLNNHTGWTAAIGGLDVNSVLENIEFKDQVGFMPKCDANTNYALEFSVPSTPPPPNIDKDYNGVVRPSSCWPGAVELVVEDDNLVAVSGYVASGTDTLKSGTLIAYVDSSNRKLYDKVGETTINADGSYSFTSVPAIPMYIKILPGENGYLESYHDSVIRGENSSPFEPDDCNGLQRDIFPRKLEPIVLDGEGVISGKVVMVEGGSNKTMGTDPIPGLDVVLDKVPPSKTIMHTQTDIDGNYFFENLPDGNYVVKLDYGGLDADTMYDVIVDGPDTVFNDLDYCVDTLSMISACEAPTGIGESISDMELSIFPNPFNNELHINANTKLDKVRIIDLRGVVVQEQTINSNTFYMSTENLTPAIYFVEITSNSSTTFSKVIKH